MLYFYLQCRTVRLACLILVLAILSAGCSGYDGGHERVQAPPLAWDDPTSGDDAFGLPSPHSLTQHLPHIDGAGSSAAWHPRDRIRLGSEYSVDLPASRVVPNGDSLAFNPEYEIGTLPDSSGLAFALFRFQLDGFSDDSLTTQWSGSPAATGSKWVGIADFSTNRWRWNALPASGVLGGLDFSPWMGPGGRIIVAVVMTGTTSESLDWLRLGGDLDPFAVINADPVTGDTPLEVSFDASQSRDYDGTIVKYEWDLDGDGSFELDTGSVPSAQHTYETANVYFARLQVTDALGNTGPAVVEIYAGTDPSLTFSFEDGWQGWTADATDVDLPGGGPGEEIPWGIELTTEEADGGIASVKMWMDNWTDSGKIWIERPFVLEPNTDYSMNINFSFGSAATGEVGNWYILAGVAPINPETRDDLFDNDCVTWEETWNGGIEGLAWLDKSYPLTVSTGPTGEVWAVVGLWGVFEVYQYYYFDNVSLNFTKLP